MWAFAIFNFTLGKVTFTFNGSVFMVYDVFPFGFTIFKRQRFPLFCLFHQSKFQLFRHAYFAHYNDKYF
ncbi:Uncharacterised protein [Salmonella enterica subsp. enterica]|nr:Uncharacterised protein [Salmonella enterica subsp. enterica]